MNAIKVSSSLFICLLIPPAIGGLSGFATILNAAIWRLNRPGLCNILTNFVTY